MYMHKLRVPGGECNHSIWSYTHGPSGYGYQQTSGAWRIAKLQPDSPFLRVQHLYLAVCNPGWNLDDSFRISWILYSTY